MWAGTGHADAPGPGPGGVVDGVCADGRTASVGQVCAGIAAILTMAALNNNLPDRLELETTHLICGCGMQVWSM